MRNRPIAVVFVLLSVAFSACQHVPPRPLDITTVRDDIKTRLDRLENIEAYAALLAASDAPEHGAFSLDDGVSLHEATLIALWYNGDARFAREEVEHARVRAQLAGLLPDPEFGGTIGEKQEDVIGGINKSLILGANLSVTIPVSGRRGATRTLRASEYKRALLEAEEVEWMTVTRLREAWHHWSAVSAHVDLLNAHLAELQSIAQLTRDLAAAGELNIVEARFFEIEYSRLSSEVARLGNDLESKRLECLRIMGLHPRADVQLVPEPWTVDDTPLPDTLSPSHPTLAKLESEYQAAEEALRLELRKQFPDITLNPGINDQEDETSITLGFGFPIPVWNANRLGIAEALAHRHDARIFVENELQRLTMDIAQELLRTAGARAQWDHLTDETLPLLEGQWDQAKVLLNSGELDITLLSNLLSQSLAVKREMIDVRLENQLAATALTAATEPYHYESVFKWETSK